MNPCEIFYEWLRLDGNVNFVVNLFWFCWNSDEIYLKCVCYKLSVTWWDFGVNWCGQIYMDVRMMHYHVWHDPFRTFLPSIWVVHCYHACMGTCFYVWYANDLLVFDDDFCRDGVEVMMRTWGNACKYEKETLFSSSFIFLWCIVCKCTIKYNMNKIDFDTLYYYYYLDALLIK